MEAARGDEGAWRALMPVADYLLRATAAAADHRLAAPASGGPGGVLDLCGVVAAAAVAVCAPRAERALRGCPREALPAAASGADAQVAAGEGLVAAGDYAAAVEAFDAAIAEDPAHPRAYNDRAVACYHLDMYDLCVSDCNKQLAVSTRHAPASYANRAVAQEALGELDAALASWDLAIYYARGACGAEPAGLRDEPQFCGEQGVLSALQVCGGVEELDGDDASPLLPHSVSHPGYDTSVGAAAGASAPPEPEAEPEGAEGASSGGAARAWVDRVSRSTASFLEQARTLVSTGEAAPPSPGAHEPEPEPAPAPKPYDHLLLRKGGLCLRLGQFTAAYAAFDDALILVPDSPEALAGRADAAIRQCQGAGGGGGGAEARGAVLTAALADARAAVALEPDVAGHHAVLGRGLACGGDPAGARAEFTAAIAAEAGSAELHLNRGVVCKALGDKGGALEDFARAAALDPASPMARLETANLLSEAGSQLAAVKEANAAIQLSPDNWLAYNTRGTVYHRMRRQREAVVDYRRSLGLLLAAGLGDAAEYRMVGANLATALKQRQYADDRHGAGVRRVPDVRSVGADVPT